MEAMRYERAMNRDILKSRLRQEEQQNKQKQKVQSMYIMECSEGIILYVKNALNMILREQRLFDCQVTDMVCFVREGTNVSEWQIAIKHGDEKIQSELYPLDTLTSISKLKKTILGKYDCTISSADKREGWNWMQEKLFRLFEKAPQVMLPSLAGWFQHGINWHFWTHSEETALLENEVISRFKTSDFPDVTAEEIIEDFSAFYEKTPDTTSFGVLQLFRSSALLARLATDSPPPMELVLVGSNAVNIARTYIRTMDGGSGNYELINLDADTITRIKGVVLSLQDTPLIIVSANLNNRNAKNKMEKIRGWLDSGYIEGKRNTVPFVFCVQAASPQCFSDRAVVLYTNDMQIPDGITVFDKLQSFVIHKIESAGMYWVDKLKKEYKEEREEEILWRGEESVSTVSEAIVSIILQLIDVDDEKLARLEMMFNEAIEEIERQFSMNWDAMVERFRSGICELLESGIIFTIPVRENSFLSEEKIVYYDGKYYFFSKEVLQTIGQKLNFDRKSLLFIKQELTDLGFVKQYRSSGSRRSELNIDISVGKSGERRSVFAIKREFWDSVGGILLYERGNRQYEINVRK